jgi:peptide/nickel transport system permease protein
VNITYYLFKRVVAILPVLLVVSILTFLMIHMLPGDPAVAILGRYADQAQLEALRNEMGLYDSLPIQYVNWMEKVFAGDMGRSLITKQPVAEAIQQRIPHTLTLSFSSLLIAMLIAIPIGIIAAAKQNQLEDRVVMLFALIGVSVPSFWAGIMLIMLFSVFLGWLPAAGYVSIWENFSVGLQYLILPSLSLGFFLAASSARMQRSSMLETLRQDYMRVARAKGLSKSKTIIKHGFKNALIPVITVIGMDFGWLLGGTAVIETVFGIPGIGRLIVYSITNRDYPVIQGAILYVAVIYMMVNLLVDVLILYIDPRISKNK